jgi:DNA-binding transcriptional ArsR family regulator
MDCCPGDVTPAVALFRSLGDPARLAILSRLTHGEARVVDLTRLLGLAQSTVSKHLACLRDCQLVDYRTEGRQSYYALTRPELIDLLRSAEQVLEGHGRQPRRGPSSAIHSRACPARWEPGSAGPAATAGACNAVISGPSARSYAPAPVEAGCQAASSPSQEAITRGARCTSAVPGPSR